MKVTLPALRCKGIQLLAAAYAFSILFILPLYADDGLILLVRSKGNMFLFSTCVSALAAFFLVVYHRFFQRQRFPSFFRFSARAYFHVGFIFLCYTISTLLSRNPTLSFFGLDSRLNGWLMFAGCCLCYCLVFSFVSARHISGLLGAMLCSISLASFIAWLNLFYIDPLGYYSYVDPSARHQFISTVGNINFFGALLCLGAPYALYQALFAARRTRLYFACAVFLSSSFLVCNSDGPWLSLLFASFIILCDKKITSKHAKRFFSILFFCFCIWLLTGLLMYVLPIYAPMRTISAILCRPAVALAGMLLCACFVFLFDKTHLSARLFFRGCFGLTVFLFGAFFILCNAFHWSLGPLDSLFQFGPQWGSNRGYVWGRLMYRYFTEFSPLEELFGIGPDMVNDLINPVYTQYIVALNGTTFDSAHNEFLQMLLCTGAVGFFFWLSFLLFHIRRSRHTAPYLTASLIAYCIQSFFSIHFPGIFPLFFVLCGFAAIGKKQF